MNKLNSNIEIVSKHIHIMWMSWAKTIVDTEPHLSEKRKARWINECFKPYEELSEDMKQLDRNFASEIIGAITLEK